MKTHSESRMVRTAQRGGVWWMWMALMGALMAAQGADPVQEALQRGLLAEEAQRDLPAAREAYAEAVRQADLQREMSALALFRLAETERLLGNTNVARELFTRLVLRYPDQTNLVQVAKPWVERRSGSPRPVDSVQHRQALAALELHRRTLERQLESWTKLSTRDLAQRLAIDQPSAQLNQLLNELIAAEQALAVLVPDLGPKHPERVKVESRIQSIEQQLDRVLSVTVEATRDRLEAVRQDINLITEYAAEEATESAAAASGAPLDPAELLRQEIALAEQQVRIAEQRLAAGQGSNEEVIKAKREVLALQRQALGRPRVQDLPEGVVSDPGPAAENPPGREEADELARLKKLAAESPDLLRRGDETPLQTAASKGWTNVVVYLLDLGISPDETSKDNQSAALHRAAARGDLALAKLLLDRGADVNARGNGAETPLHAAARAGHRAMAELLIQRGADLDRQTEVRKGGETGWEGETGQNTPLHLAATYGSPAMVELLIRKGASVTVTNGLGQMPLFAAILSGQTDCVRRLLAAGSPVNSWARDSLGKRRRSTPLEQAVRRRDTELLKLLLESGASPHFSNEDGTTALHLAAITGNAAAVDLLLRAGAGVNAQNRNGRTPFDLTHPGLGESRSQLFAAGGTNAMSLKMLFRKDRVIITPDADGLVPQRPSNDPPNLLVFGEVFRIVPVEAAAPPKLRALIQSLHPPATADLSRVEVTRRAPDSGEPEFRVVDLSSPDGDLELSAGDRVFVPALPRKP